ncbi:MAG: hypothetical protein KF802_00455 [Bdellovibrionaceae bacterium]|nr:hypothetical protein [Pseudobdellovibrionaceae bacterium]MBX3034735.1 hypothetical protein [Pseudobdellovibrionaceae bacterium]
MATTQTHSSRKSSKKAMPKSMTGRKSARKSAARKSTKNAKSTSARKSASSKTSARKSPSRVAARAKGSARATVKARGNQRENWGERETADIRQAQQDDTLNGGRAADEASNERRPSRRAREQGTDTNASVKSQRNTPHFNPGVNNPGARRH